MEEQLVSGTWKEEGKLIGFVHERKHTVMAGAGCNGSSFTKDFLLF